MSNTANTKEQDQKPRISLLTDKLPAATTQETLQKSLAEAGIKFQSVAMLDSEAFLKMSSS
jgi:hypothetical protein